MTAVGRVNFNNKLTTSVYLYLENLFILKSPDAMVLKFAQYYSLTSHKTVDYIEGLELLFLANVFGLY